MPLKMASTVTVEEESQTDMDNRDMDTLSLQELQRNLDDLKESVEYAHQNNLRTQTRVGNVVSGSQLTNQRLDRLEREVNSLKSYTRDLENYCISLDCILRKHHLLLNGVPETPGESVGQINARRTHAKDKGHEARMMGTKVIIFDISYKHMDLHMLPQGLKLSDSKIVKVKGGLVFATGNAYLSNFYKCDVKFNGMVFDSAERAYQYERCTRLGAPEIALQVLDARGAKECKQAASFVKSNNEWDAQKRDIMKLIVYEKFSQNEILLDRLLMTGKKALIEATVDMFWGASAVIGSKLLKNGTWKGRNELGLILAEI